MNRRRRVMEQSGTALLLALVFIGAIGAIGLASLDAADESFREDRAAQTFRTEIYSGGGALDALVAAMRADGAWGRDGGACPGLTAATPDGAEITVACTPLPGSGALVVGGLGARADRVVDLAADIGGRRAARERVEFVDGGGNSPGAIVRVRNWTVAA
jgi:hypothetical protein